METVKISFEILDDADLVQVKKVIRAIGGKKIRTENPKIPTKLERRIAEAEKERAEGELIPVDPENLWESLGLT
ncbi:hypothetical protein SAMN05443429_10532 [Cruoricaptor ignavus]|uniref:Uncharacterized protein n=1 Tax=Cruoricaptor ignavus TaxID=1118202 RepID=A0A1M6E9F6_9FLAO|nr:hypothetical protein [Cruoricaptor ignavus]QOR74345.1 hypothetical protein IMZ16_02575 [Cruoricaptor ignavus]SHI82154.1 hypothetical protein SAMN05443429_10532 [Cruoricaptor ignavus]